jgi:hypothetical protein
MKIKFGAASIFGLGILVGNLAIPVMYAQLRTIQLRTRTEIVAA